jgi:WD40 repeat protein/uncharacterized caspase-like protein
LAGVRERRKAFPLSALLRSFAIFFLVSGLTILAQEQHANLVVQDQTMPEDVIKGRSGDGSLLLTGAGNVIVEPGVDFGQNEIPTTAILWDTASGRKLRELRGHTKPVVCTAISPDNATLLTVSADGTARLWKAATGAELQRLDTSNLRPISCSWASKGYAIAIGGKSGVVRMFSGKTYGSVRNILMSQRAVENLAFSPDGRTLAMADGQQLIVWDAATGAIRRAGHMIGDVLWDGKKLYAELKDYSRDILDPYTSEWDPKTLKRLDVHWTSGYMWPQTPEPADSTDATDHEENVGDSKRSAIWQFKPINSGASVSFAGGDKSLLIYSSGSDHGSVALWGLKSGKPLQVFRDAVSPFDAATKDGSALCLRVYGDASGVAAESGPAMEAESRPAMIVVDPLTGQKLSEQDPRSSCPNPEMSDDTVHFGNELMDRYDLDGHLGSVSPDRRYFVAQEGDAAYVREASTGKLAAMCMGTALQFSRDSSRILCDGDNPRIITLKRDASSTDDHPALSAHRLQMVVRGENFHIDGIQTFLSAPQTDRILLRMADGSVRIVTYSRLAPIVTLQDVPSDALLGQAYDDWESRYRADPKRGLSDEVWQRSYRTEGINACFSSDGTIVAIGGRLGSYIYSGTTGARLAAIYRFGDDGWAVVTPDGRFDTNQLDGQTPLHWVASDAPMTPLPLEVFLRDYYTPGLLALVLRGETPPRLRSIAEITNRVQPDVAITSVKTSPSAGVDVIVHAASHKASTGQQSGLRDLRLFRDGQMVADGYREGSLEDGDFTFHSVMLKSDSKNVKFTAYAFNSERIKSATASFDYDSSLASRLASKPHAYLLHIGVNQYVGDHCTLHYAVSDADAMSDTFIASMSAHGYTPVAVKLVAPVKGDPAAAGKQRIHDELQKIAAAATPDDVFFMTFSGHGYSDSSERNGGFYLLPSGLIGSCRKVDDALLRASISADELAQWLRPIDAGEMTLILDACDSAASVNVGGFKPGPLGSRGLGQLAYDKRMRVLAASQADESAQESDKLLHGVLTYALIQSGLAEHKADWKPVDKKITVGEWLSYAEMAVPQYTLHQTQTATKSAGDRFGNDGKTIQVPALFDFSKADTLVLQ